MPAIAREVTSLDATTASCGFWEIRVWNLDKTWENSFVLLLAVGPASSARRASGLMSGGLRRSGDGSSCRGAIAAEVAETGRASKFEMSAGEFLVDIDSFPATGFRFGGVCNLRVWSEAVTKWGGGGLAGSKSSGSSCLLLRCNISSCGLLDCAKPESLASMISDVRSIDLPLGSNSSESSSLSFMAPPCCSSEREIIASKGSKGGFRRSGEISLSSFTAPGL